MRDLEEGEWADPEFLRAVKELARPFSITEGETKVHDLEIVDWRK